MGFLKKHNLHSSSSKKIFKTHFEILWFKIFITFISLLIAGCASSKIQYDVKEDSNPYSMFGENPSRTFYTDAVFSDSLLKKWETDINGSFINSSVSVYSDLVFINDLSGRVYCFNIDNGKQVGKLKIGNAVFTTPVLNKNIVIVISAVKKDNESILQYYDYKNAKIFRESYIKGRVTSEIIKADDGIVFITEDGVVYKYDVYGFESWKLDTKVFTHSSPALKNDVIVFGNDKGELIGIDAVSGKIKYKTAIGKTFFASPTIIDNSVYIGNDNGLLYEIDLLSGKIIWKFDTGGRIIMTPVNDGKNIYVGNLKGELFSIDIKTHTLNWKTKFDNAFGITPLVSNNIIALPGIDTRLLFINKSDGELIKTIILDGRVKLTPVYSKNILFIGYDNGILAAYEFK